MLAGLFHQHLINVWHRTRVVASLRPGIRGDGSAYVEVLYRPNGKQSSTSFEDLASAGKLSRQGIWGACGGGGAGSFGSPAATIGPRCTGAGGGAGAIPLLVLIVMIDPEMI